MQAWAQSPDSGDARGKLLYATHCHACHGTQIHWRDKRLVTDWTSLNVQVRRWQANTGLAWSDEDIAAVARHLNAVWYRFPALGGNPAAIGEPDRGARRPD
jgi:mono/diheme cytochrome c family protein